MVSQLLGDKPIRRLERRRFLSAACAFSAVGFLSNPVSAQPRTDFDSLYTKEVDDAIERGMRFLLSRQVADGSFTTTKWGQSTAVCGLIGISMLSRGVRSGLGAEGKSLDSIARFILSRAQDSGFLCNEQAKSHGDMYEHGFATLFLSEYYGSGAQDATGVQLRKAVDLIVRCQNPQGGWRYKPVPVDADISVTVCQAMALRAARNAGIAVPVETIDRLVGYLRRSQNADGGFMYQLSGGESRFPLSAAAAVALYNAGISSGPIIDEVMQYLRKNFGSCRSPEANYFYYAHYYSVQAFRHFAKDEWPTWYSNLRDIILSRQRSDGAWFDHSSNEYGTAMACMILNMPRSELPIFQS